jgi:hypothetical protein
MYQQCFYNDSFLSLSDEDMPYFPGVGGDVQLSPPRFDEQPIPFPDGYSRYSCLDLLDPLHMPTIPSPEEQHTNQSPPNCRPETPGSPISITTPTLAPPLPDLAPTTKRKPHPFSIDALLLSTPAPQNPTPTRSWSTTDQQLPFSVSLTKRKKPQLNMGGFLFYLQKKNKNGTQLFVCQQKKKTKCPVSITVDKDLTIILRMSSCHNHV